MTGSVTVAREEAVFYRRAAEIIADAPQAAVGTRGRFTIALSGGNTPVKLFELLASDPFRSRIPWDKTFVFWGDERCVPPDSKDSNYRLAYDLLLSKVPVPEANVFRMKGEAASPAEAAIEYEGLLKRTFEDRPFPKFDLMLQGMGDDGHTASLFPGSAALGESQKWVVANRVEKLKAFRLTVTFPVINAARRTLMLIGGANKAEILYKVLGGLSVGYPVERVKPQGDFIWLLDAGAASKLGANVRQHATYL